MGRPKSRLTVVESYYHSHTCEDASRFSSNFDRVLENVEEQAYVRKLFAGPEWEPLDHGWLQRASFLLIKNLQEAPRLDVHMDAETLQRMDPQDIEFEAEQVPEPQLLAESLVIGWLHPGQVLENLEPQWVIYPSESIRGTPYTLNNLYIRSNVGRVKYQITIIPK